jgi:radical SAM superfamily enzyme YgiQ (UPF0313 family)
MLLSRFMTCPPLSLAYVAAVTPEDWEVSIHDENFDRFTFEDADLVGITTFTSTINRAYELASAYRARGTPVVMGGIHVSMVPKEALRYADAVVVGEVEGVWQKVLSDFEHGNLGGIYSGQAVDLGRDHVRPRHDLLHPEYRWAVVQTSRGCPFNCHFCSVSRYLGSRYRQRMPEDVLDEIETLPGKNLFFLDDNLVGHTEESMQRAKDLFTGMAQRQLGKRWWMQTSINLADNEELIRLAAQAGCMFVFIGFEAIDQEVLRGMKKSVNLKVGVENYRAVVDRFHRHGIGVLGGFVIGNDFESRDYYRRLADFIVSAGIDTVQLTLLTPLPGTALMEQLRDEGRLIYTDFPGDWDKYRFSYMVHVPRGIEADTVYAGTNFIKKRLYSFPTYQRRLLRSFLAIRNPAAFYAVCKANAAYKRAWLNSHYHEKYPTEL